MFLRRLVIFCFSLFLLAQTSFLSAQINEVFEKYQIENSLYLSASVAWHPNQENICAISNTHGHPLYIYNTSTRNIERKIEITGYYAGSNISWSSDAKFLLLEQKFYLDFSPNKDRALQYEVLDVTSGTTILKLEKVHSACFSLSGDQLIVLKDEMVEVYDLPSGKKLKNLSIPGARSGLALGSLPNEILVNHTPSSKDLDAIPSISGNKKVKKAALKYRTVISVFDLGSGKRKRLIPELYDVVYSMKKNGNKVLVYAKPHTKLNTGSGNGGYINQIDISTCRPITTGFQTNFVEPDYKINPAGDLIGVISSTHSQSGRASLILYNLQSGKIEYKFAPHYGVAQAWGKKELNDNRAYFLFHDNNEEVFFVLGNQIYQWKFR